MRSIQPSVSTDPLTEPATRLTPSPQPALDFSEWQPLFQLRREEFIPQIHLAGRFGSEGVHARINARQRMLRGLSFKWISGIVRESLLRRLLPLLDNILAARLAWRNDEGIESQLVDLRSEVLKSEPAFILHELLRNAFDAHARANRQGPISLSSYARVDDTLVIDVSDDGIGIKCVQQKLSFLQVHHNDLVPNWTPFVEGMSGIGLMWSKFVAELHGGSLEFLKDVYPGQKTTARVAFPPGALKISVA